LGERGRPGGGRGRSASPGRSRRGTRGAREPGCRQGRAGLAKAGRAGPLGLGWARLPICGRQCAGLGLSWSRLPIRWRHWTRRGHRAWQTLSIRRGCRCTWTTRRHPRKRRRYLLGQAA
jgi:hypothetical protein